MPSLSAEQRKLASLVAIHTRHARGRSAAVREPVLVLIPIPARFEDEVDPDRTLDPAERARRAGHAFRAHLARLELEALRARSRPAVAAS